MKKKQTKELKLKELPTQWKLKIGKIQKCVEGVYSVFYDASLINSGTSDEEREQIRALIEEIDEELEVFRKHAKT